MTTGRSNMTTKKKGNRDKALLTSNHNRMLSYEQNDISQTPVVEVEQAELEAIAAALRVRSGLQAGLQPCI
jgi:hypothetical protein